MLHQALTGLLALTLLGAAAPSADAASTPVSCQKAKRSTALTPPAERPAAWIDHWAEFIRPSADELSYESIGWRNQFWPAVQLAQELGRPVLLWTMNGHPLGCT